MEGSAEGDEHLQIAEREDRTDRVQVPRATNDWNLVSAYVCGDYDEVSVIGQSHGRILAVISSGYTDTHTRTHICEYIWLWRGTIRPPRK